MFTEIFDMLLFNITRDGYLDNAQEEIQILTGWFEKTNKIEKIKRRLRYNGE